MSDESRIDALRRRLQKDPGSIAFAQLAEEYRRAGRLEDAIEVCRAGLARHPGYLSARVTLGRALLDVGDVDSAEQELSDVIRVAPDNLSAIRGLADVHRQRGESPEALEQFRAAFEMARPDPTIEQIVRDLRREAEEPSFPPMGGRPAGRAASDVVDTLGPDFGGPATPAAAAGLAAFEPVPAEDPRAARRTVAYLERWLQAIVADRRSRLYGAHA